MRAVADSLGLRAASLYRYVDSRAEVLDLMADSALGEFQLPELDEGPWVDQLLAIAHEQRRVYLRHPWLLEATRSTGSFGPNALRFFDVCLAILTPVEVPTSRKMEALAMMTGVVTLFAARRHPRTSTRPGCSQRSSPTPSRFRTCAGRSRIPPAEGRLRRTCSIGPCSPC